MVIPSHYATARNRVPKFTGIREERHREVTAILPELVRKRFKALVDIPPVVLSAPDKLDLLHPILPHVRQPELAGNPVKTEAPRIAEPVSPNLRGNSGLP